MAFIDLAEVHEFLNKTKNVDDGEMQQYINTACDLVESLKGHVSQADFTVEKMALSYQGSVWPGSSVRYMRRQYVVELTETPVLSVTSVNAVNGAVNTLIAQGNQMGLDGGWWLQDCLVHVPHAGLYSIAYTAGRATVPDRYRQAALELVGHLWDPTQMSAGTPRQHLGRLGDSAEMIIPGVPSAMQYRVRELLDIWGPVVPDHVVIA